MNPTQQPQNPKEIDARLRRRYLDRLETRVKRLRRLLVERNWEELRSECEHLAVTGETFGFRDLTDLAMETHNMMPPGRISRAATPLRAKERAESLITAVDALLVERSLN